MDDTVQLPGGEILGILGAVTKAHRKKAISPAAIRFGALLMRLCRRTYRVTVVDPGGFREHMQPWPVVVALWHNRVALLSGFFPRRFHERTVALASASRDGETAARALEAFQFQVVRGSSSRGGYQALRELRRKLDENLSAALTVDGPRGPRYGVHPGVVLLAEWSGRPVLPVCVNAPRRWELKGWDRTQVPKPFSRVTLVIGEPLFIPPELSSEAREQQCARVREALLHITDDAIAGQPSNRP